MGHAPGLASFERVAQALDPGRNGGFAVLRGEAAPSGALVVLAGQQPCFAAGAALIAHKAATAVALARDLSSAWSRPVVPVFLLATEDHDSSEVDHIDLVDDLDGRIRRFRARILPGSDASWRSTYATNHDSVLTSALKSCCDQLNDVLKSTSVHSSALCELSRVHGAALLAAFGPLGLRVVEAHALRPLGDEIIRRALTRPDQLRASLERGQHLARTARLQPSFDAGDPRPLVMESRGGRRRRVAAEDREAARRHDRSPEDFSPHAALRPLVQAASLPVVAQVCGPSELRYLGEARLLHQEFGLIAPVLVPRLEASFVSPALLGSLPGGLEGLDLGASRSTSGPAEHAVREALRDFARTFDDGPARIAARAERWRRSTESAMRRLAEQRAWHTRPRSLLTATLSPRGRPQDTVLAWLPDALEHGGPASWGRRLVDLARPLDPPRHVLHTTDPESRDG